MRSDIGDYRIVSELGRGGMGVVYRAEHRRLGREVALKVLQDRALSARFINEARLQAGLAHPSIATLFDYFEADGRACIAMELVEGETLAERLARHGPLGFAEAVRLLRPVAEAVAMLHRHGIIHRDLKAHNVKVTPAGRVALLDFGIAKDLSATGLTTGDAVPGTPEYLSPEQVRGRPPDARSDVWALGVLFYELLTGDVPFRAPSSFGLFERIARGHYDAPSRRAPGLPPQADALVARCLQTDPAARFADAGALLAALGAPERPAQPGRPRRHAGLRGARLAAALFLAVAVTAFGVALGSATREPPPPPVAPPQVATPPPAGAVASEVTIDALGGAAEVYRDGERLGETPFQLATWVGEPVELELRRGDAREPVRFQTTAGKRAYTVLFAP